MDNSNGIASILKIFSYIIIGLCVISGIYYGTSDSFIFLGDAQSSVGWGIVLEGLIIGFVFLGISEVIKLLQGIYNQKEISIIKTAPYVNNVNNSIHFDEEKVKNYDYKIEPDQKPVSENIQNKIENFYNKQGIIVQYIKGTSSENIYYVKMLDGVELVELKPGLTPVVLEKK